MRSSLRVPIAESSSSAVRSLLARVDAPAFAAQPFAVEQVGEGECHANAGAAPGAVARLSA